MDIDMLCLHVVHILIVSNLPGTKRLECVSPDGSGRRVIHPGVNYPFSMVAYQDHFYYTDWRR